MPGIIGTVQSWCENNIIDWTQTVTVDAGHNCLWIGIAVNRYDLGSREVASLLYDGSTVTKDGQVDLGGEDMHWQWWYIFDPSAGANILAATHSGTGDIAHSIHAVSLGNINTAIDPRTPVGTGATGVTSRSATVTTEFGDLVMAIAGPNANRTIVASSGSTELGEVYCSYDVQYIDGWSGYRKATGTSTAIGCEWTTASKAGICANAFATLAGGSKMILMMSEIYDRIQENRKKIGVSDFGNFGLRDGLWKPKQRLVTI